MNERLEPVYRARTVAEAQLLADALGRASIAAHVIDGHEAGAAEQGGGVGRIRVAVGEADVADAKDVVAFFEARRAQRVIDGEVDSGDAVDAAGDSTVEATWPRCPQCGVPRRVLCGQCGAIGSELPRAEYPGEKRGTWESLTVGDFVVSLCATCSEPFEPAPLKECECGYRFDEGVEIPQDATDTLGRLGMVLVAALGVVLVALVAYFWQLFTSDALDPRGGVGGMHRTQTGWHVEPSEVVPHVA